MLLFGKPNYAEPFEKIYQIKCENYHVIVFEIKQFNLFNCKVYSCKMHIFKL